MRHQHGLPEHRPHLRRYTFQLSGALLCPRLRPWHLWRPLHRLYDKPTVSVNDSTSPSASTNALMPHRRNSRVMRLTRRFHVAGPHSIQRWLPGWCRRPYTFHAFADRFPLTGDPEVREAPRTREVTMSDATSLC